MGVGRWESGRGYVNGWGVGGSGKEELGAWGSVWVGLCKSRGGDIGVGAG